MKLTPEQAAEVEGARTWRDSRASQNSGASKDIIASPKDTSPATIAGSESLTVPSVEGMTVLDAALAYAAAGWFVGPVARGTKHPGSILGTGWQHQTSRDEAQLREWFTDTDHGVFWHVGRSGGFVFDVDQPDALPDLLRGELNRCEPPFASSRPDTPGKGHYVFAMPLGVTLGNSAGSLGGEWGDVRGKNGVIVVAPSEHADHAAGAEYRWVRTGEVPVVPPVLVQAMAKKAERTGPPLGERGQAAVFARELVALAHATPGQDRNKLLNSTGLAIGKLVGPVVSEDLARSMLTEVSRALGLDDREIETTIASGFVDGLEDPRELEGAPTSFLFRTGGSFALDTPTQPVPVWGDGDQVLWADGEALQIAAPQGVGKTTIGQQLMLGRCGVPTFETLLGFPVRPGLKKTLYLAMDRPKQAARSLSRMVEEQWRATLDDKLVVWEGPPPADLAKHPEVLAQMCVEAGADSVVVDSLKDAAIGLSDDEVGAGWNRARQTALAAGVQVIELHHNRKTTRVQGKQASIGIDDIYGSTWITSGAGSVILLLGAAGDPVVDFHHVKQPAAEVGPFKVLHDHDAGRTQVFHALDLLDVVRARHELTAKEAARVLFDVEKPTDAQTMKARRRLDALTKSGQLQPSLPDQNGASTWKLP